MANQQKIVDVRQDRIAVLPLPKAKLANFNGILQILNICLSCLL